MHIRFNHITPVACMLLLAMAGCSSRSLTSSKETQGIVIDGKTEDWPEVTMYQRESGLSYGVYNDDQHIYVLLSTTEPALQRSIMTNGLTLWVSGNQKKEKTKGIIFPLGQQTAPPPKGPRPDGGQPLEPGQIELMMKPEAELIGMMSGEPVKVNLQDLPLGINGAIGMNEKAHTLAYEVRIPIEVIYQGVKPKKAEKRKLTLGIETSASESLAMGGWDDGMDMMGGPGGPPPGGMGQPGGGAPSGGGPGGRPPAPGMEPDDFAQSSQSAKLWIDVQLDQEKM